ncbi:MAG TPA: ubiquinol-cytochrome c reductase iron-sulfur subunit [Blastocatellia bacterium]|nr:ubiquinol-cytochrome c reductase iron-sulfur subunit [Blastocatellia bacterium]
MTTKIEPTPETASSRRSFLGVLLSFIGATTGVLLSVPLFRFALHPLLAATTETAWSDLGAEDEFADLSVPAKRVIKIEQLDGWRRVVSEKAVYVIKGKDGQEGKLRVLSAVCPHLGCAITWGEAKQQFVCPCHAGIFAADGSLVSGPPPRAMDDLEHRIENGRLQVRYQYFRQLIPTKEVIA